MQVGGRRPRTPILEHLEEAPVTRYWQICYSKAVPLRWVKFPREGEVTVPAVARHREERVPRRVYAVGDCFIVN